MEHTTTSAGAYASVPQDNSSRFTDVTDEESRFTTIALDSPALPQNLDSERALLARNNSISTTSSVELPEHVAQCLKDRAAGTYRVTDPALEQSFETLATKAPEKTVRVEELDVSKVYTKAMADAYIAAHPLPQPLHSVRYNKIRYGFFSVYRRLFAVVFLFNLITMCSFGALNIIRPGFFSYSMAATAVGANIVATSIARHEHFINMLFRIVIAIPLSWPLWFRRHAAKIYSFGGVHSGCGVSASLWYICFTVLLLGNYDGPEGILNAFRITVAIMLFLFFVLIGLAYPTIRAKYHNQWEWTHRFAGYGAVCIIITQTAILIWSQAHATGTAWGLIMVQTPSFWFLIIVLCLLAYPWIRLRKVTFDEEKISDHSILLTIHSNKLMPTCKGIRLATRPLFENHGFATIPNEDGKRGYTVLIAKNGDWTTKLVDQAPKYLWTRGAPTMGVMGVALVLRRVVVMATGTGIGPTLSFFQCHPEWACRIVWTVRSPESSFGPAVNNAVRRCDPDAVVYDTFHGRTDIVGLAYAAYKEFNAEAVVIISNPVLTKKVVYGMETRGVAAFGAIWDS